VTHYCSHLSVATLRLESGTTLRVGDMNIACMPRPEGHMTSYIARRKFLATLSGRGASI